MADLDDFFAKKDRKKKSKGKKSKVDKDKEGSENSGVDQLKPIGITTEVRKQKSIRLPCAQAVRLLRVN